MLAKWLNKPQISNHAEFINFAYQILFSRPAEDAAIDHWSAFLKKGLGYKDFFEKLWRSEEFATKAEQNPYLKKPMHDNALSELKSKSDSVDLINDEMLQTIIEKLSQERNLLLQIDKIRSLVAQWRYRDLCGPDKIQFYDAASDSGIIKNTVIHNEAALRSYVGIARCDEVISPLKSIDATKDKLNSLKVLSIGARTEFEFFSLLAAGFTAKNITVVDLFSYSPYIELGDMHQLQYADNSFDVVVISTVLLCSNNKPQAAREMIRILKSDGIVALGDRRPPEDCIKADSTPLEFQIQSEHLASCEDVLKLFHPHVKNIYFTSNPTPPFNSESSIIALFSIEKP